MVLTAEREVATGSVLREITADFPILQEYISNITATAKDPKEVEEIGNRRRIVTGDGWIEYRITEDQDRLEASQRFPHIEVWDELEVEVQKVKITRYSGPKLILEVFLGDGTSETKQGVIRPDLDHNGRLTPFLTIQHPRNSINNTTEY